MGYYIVIFSCFLGKHLEGDLKEKKDLTCFTARPKLGLALGQPCNLLGSSYNVILGPDMYINCVVFGG